MSQIELLGPVFTLEEIQEIVGEGFKVVLLSSSITPEGYRVRYFPLVTSVEDRGVGDSGERITDLPERLAQIKEAFTVTLEYELNKANFQEGVIYFAPADTFATAGKEAQLGYVFKKENELEAQIRFIIKGEIK